MRVLARVVLIGMLIAGTLPLLAANAVAGSRPCGLGGSRAQNERLAMCLAHEPGLQVSRREARKVGLCESGFYRRSHRPGSPYYGIYQLMHIEFTHFAQQGPRWVDREFRRWRYGIYSARGNILATLAHTHRYGWSYSSCR